MRPEPAVGGSGVRPDPGSRVQCAELGLSAAGQAAAASAVNDEVGLQQTAGLQPHKFLLDLVVPGV